MERNLGGTRRMFRTSLLPRLRCLRDEDNNSAGIHDPQTRQMVKEKTDGVGDIAAAAGTSSWTMAQAIVDRTFYSSCLQSATNGMQK